MQLARSFLYRDHKVNLLINQFQNRGYVYIDNILIDYINNAKIDQLTAYAEKMIDQKKYGNIFNTSF